MVKIDTNDIKNLVYKLCRQAGESLSQYTFEKLYEMYKNKPSQKLANILQNGKEAKKNEKPICQDTGMVHVFLEVGDEIHFSGNPIKAINEAVSECYKENYFRKSIVENNFISGKNTLDNTPAIVNIDYTEGDEVKIKVLLKGGGCDNASTVQMLLPSTDKEEFTEFVVQNILKKGKNACPPLFVSVASGTCAEEVMKKAEKQYFEPKNENDNLAREIIKRVNERIDEKFKGNFLADVKIGYYPHHMASFPVATCINCHALRIAEGIVTEKGIKILTPSTEFQAIQEIENLPSENFIEINTNDINKIRSLKEGDNVLLSGELLIARDAAHKKMLEIKQKGEKIPFDIKEKIIFYSAPTPCKDGNIGVIGPTTAIRMDKYIKEFPEILGTIGKGERTEEACEEIKKNKSVYFEVEGGIASLLSQCIENYKVIAFEELLSEAVAVVKVKNLPAKVAVI